MPFAAISTAEHVQQKYSRARARLKALHHAQRPVLQHWKMAANICMALETLASTESNRQGVNIKGIAHTGMKDIHTKAMVITLASLVIPMGL